MVQVSKFFLSCLFLYSSLAYGVKGDSCRALLAESLKSPSRELNRVIKTMSELLQASPREHSIILAQLNIHLNQLGVISTVVKEGKTDVIQIDLLNLESIPSSYIYDLLSRINLGRGVASKFQTLSLDPRLNLDHVIGDPFYSNLRLGIGTFQEALKNQSWSFQAYKKIASILKHPVGLQKLISAKDLFEKEQPLSYDIFSAKHYAQVVLRYLDTLDLADMHDFSHLSDAKIKKIFQEELIPYFQELVETKVLVSEYEKIPAEILALSYSDQLLYKKFWRLIQVNGKNYIRLNFKFGEFTSLEKDSFYIFNIEEGELTDLKNILALEESLLKELPISPYKFESLNEIEQARGLSGEEKKSAASYYKSLLSIQSEILQTASFPYVYQLQKFKEEWGFLDSIFERYVLDAPLSFGEVNAKEVTLRKKISPQKLLVRLRKNLYEYLNFFY